MERKIVWAEAQIWAGWGEICASGAPNDFSRPSETPNAPTHYSEEPKITPFVILRRTPYGAAQAGIYYLAILLDSLFPWNDRFVRLSNGFLIIAHKLKNAFSPIPGLLVTAFSAFVNLTLAIWALFG